MKINEIRAEAHVNITVKQGDRFARLDTKAVLGTPDGLLVNLIKHEEQVVLFNAESHVDIKIIIVDINDVVYAWNNVEITTTTYQGNNYHLISSHDEVQSVNRRESYRLFLGEEGTIKLVESRKEYEVTVKDLSETGIGIVCDEDIGLEPNTLINVKFEDKTSMTKFDLRARVVRKENKDSHILYGCKLISKSDAIGKYVMKKQREKRQNKNRA